ncbi:AMEP412 family response elicitor [Neobacillus niacini]|uniref:AMEP412 family response elicitor n=1 Tax=Neobacillus niacini TaxID=86668 RepID=UPI002379E122|nr:AMEP412 family response elicitor [Neobacillus niacini]
MKNKDKVAAFLKWAYDLATVAAGKTYAQATKILNYIQANPGKIVDWFLKGYSVYDIIRIILG